MNTIPKSDLQEFLDHCKEMSTALNHRGEITAKNLIIKLIERLRMMDAEINLMKCDSIALSSHCAELEAKVARVEELAARWNALFAKCRGSSLPTLNAQIGQLGIDLNDLVAALSGPAMEKKG